MVDEGVFNVGVREGTKVLLLVELKGKKGLNRIQPFTHKPTKKRYSDIVVRWNGEPGALVIYDVDKETEVVITEEKEVKEEIKEIKEEIEKAKASPPTTEVTPTAGRGMIFEETFAGPCEVEILDEAGNRFEASQKKAKDAPLRLSFSVPPKRSYKVHVMKPDLSEEPILEAFSEWIEITTEGHAIPAEFVIKTAKIHLVELTENKKRFINPQGYDIKSMDGGNLTITKDVIILQNFKESIARFKISLPKDFEFNPKFELNDYSHDVFVDFSNNAELEIPIITKDVKIQVDGVEGAIFMNIKKVISVNGKLEIEEYPYAETKIANGSSVPLETGYYQIEILRGDKHLFTTRVYYSTSSLSNILYIDVPEIDKVITDIKKIKKVEIDTYHDLNKILSPELMGAIRDGKIFKEAEKQKAVLHELNAVREHFKEELEHGGITRKGTILSLIMRGKEAAEFRALEHEFHKTINRLEEQLKTTKNIEARKRLDQFYPGLGRKNYSEKFGKILDSLSAKKTIKQLGAILKTKRKTPDQRLKAFIIALRKHLDDARVALNGLENIENELKGIEALIKIVPQVPEKPKGFILGKEKREYRKAKKEAKQKKSAEDYVLPKDVLRTCVKDALREIISLLEPRTTPNRALAHLGWTKSWEPSDLEKIEAYIENFMEKDPKLSVIQSDNYQMKRALYKIMIILRAFDITTYKWDTQERFTDSLFVDKKRFFKHADELMLRVNISLFFRNPHYVMIGPKNKKWKKVTQFISLYWKAKKRIS